MSDNPQFERNFADLAFAVLKQRASNLLPYMIGFQVLDKSDDETRAAGVFGFKLGELWLLAPRFFLEGELKGNELLYLKGPDSFVPFKDNWVNYLLNRKPTNLGQPTAQTESELGMIRPDFSLYGSSPLRKAAEFHLRAEFGRGSFGLEKKAELPGNFDPRLSVNLFEGMAKHDQAKFDKAAANIDLRSVCQTIGEPAVKAVFSALLQFPKFSSAFLKFYAPADLIKAAASKPKVLDSVDTGDFDGEEVKVPGTRGSNGNSCSWVPGFLQRRGHCPRLFHCRNTCREIFPTPRQ